MNPPMVLTHKNWQLCCLVEHSSRSEKEKLHIMKLPIILTDELMVLGNGL